MAAIRRLRGRDTQRPGELSFAQYHLLFGLAEHEELSTGELAARRRPRAGDRDADARQPREMGLVDRIRSERDRRVVTCSLTGRGDELIRERRAY